MPLKRWAHCAWWAHSKRLAFEFFPTLNPVPQLQGVSFNVSQNRHIQFKMRSKTWTQSHSGTRAHARTHENKCVSHKRLICIIKKQLNWENRLLQLHTICMTWPQTQTHSCNTRTNTHQETRCRNNWEQIAQHLKKKKKKFYRLLLSVFFLLQLFKPQTII